MSAKLLFFDCFPKTQTLILSSMFLLTKFLSPDIKLDGHANHLQSASRAYAASMHSIDARLVLACRKAWRVERESVSFISAHACCHKVWSGIICCTALNEMVINVKLHLYAIVRLRAIYHPAFHP